jgi:hypothetical protein
MFQKLDMLPPSGIKRILFSWATKEVVGSLYTVVSLYNQMWKIEIKARIKPPEPSVDIRYHQ